MGDFNINDTLKMVRNKLAWLITVFFSKKKSIAGLLTHTKPVAMLLIAVLVVMASFYGSVFIQEANTKTSSTDIQNPSPSQESSANLNQAPTVQDDLQKAAVKGAQVISNPTPTTVYVPPSTPTPTFDPDPIVICKSKTGDLRVKKSICGSYTNCPDGYGGYIFESQNSCKQRWERIGKDLNDAVGDYNSAIMEGVKLQGEIRQNEFDNSMQAIQDNTNKQLDQINKDVQEINKDFQEDLNKGTQDYQEYLKKNQEDYDALYKDLLKVPTPTPTQRFQCNDCSSNEVNF